MYSVTDNQCVRMCRLCSDDKPLLARLDQCGKRNFPSGSHPCAAYEVTKLLCASQTLLWQMSLRSWLYWTLKRAQPRPRE